VTSLKKRLGPPLLVVLGVITVFWKLVLTDQYTFLASPDMSNQVMPWLQASVAAIRHGYMLWWTPYEWFGQSLVGQVQPSVVCPFTFLLALAPVKDGLIQVQWVHWWFVLIHCAAGLFAYWFFVDLDLGAAAAVLGGIFYATAGFCGNTDWPEHLTAGIWAPLVFLFLLRALRGRTPVKSAAWAGVALGLAWMSGHHAHPLSLTLAVAGVGVAALVRFGLKRDLLVRLALVFGLMAIVAAVQLLPAREYGRYAKRWTETGALTWKDKVEFPEHQHSGMRPSDLLNLVFPGSGIRTDPFVGIVGISLAAFAIWSAFRRREVRLLAVVAACALLYALAQFDALYGLFYSLVPLVETSRAPVVMLSVFHFAVASLVAFGASALFAEAEQRRERTVIKGLVWFGGVTLGLFALFEFLKPAVSSRIVDGDPRIGMIGLVALLLAAVFQAWRLGYVRREWALAMVGLLLIVEQGNEAGNAWAHFRQADRMQSVWALYNTLDIADYLRHQPDPKRLEYNDKDVKFSFGDWYRLDSAWAMTASMLAATSDLGGWWSDRVGRMYGTNYLVSRAPTHDGLKEMFTGKSGIKVYYNPEAFPRAWIVHQTVIAKDDKAGGDLVNGAPFDLRTTAVLVKNGPTLETCTGTDRVASYNETHSMTRMNVELACTGLLVVSDNWYPGWTAQVDGRYVGIWKVNTVIRGIVVPKGKHQVVMRYQPFTVRFGLVLTVLGFAAAVVLQKRREQDGADYLSKSSS